MATPLAPIALSSPEPDEHYPESDGKPMAETEVHVQCLSDVREVLRAFFRLVMDVYVGANMQLYYERGNPRRSVAPDIFLVRGIPKRVRPTYRTWEEGKPPDFVLEITSDSARREDLVTKYRLYEWLGVGEYFLYDPLGDYLRPSLQGHRLVGGRYQRLEPTAGGGLLSAVLGLELRRRDDGAGDPFAFDTHRASSSTRALHGLHILDPQTECWLPTPDELAMALDAEVQARRQAEARANAEAVAHQRAADELAQLRAEIARLRGQRDATEF
jgi:Uma2 family endonuclease